MISVVDHFRNAHCVGRKKGSGRRVSVRTPEKKTEIKNLISANRRWLVRKLHRRTGMLTSSVHRTLHDLKLYLYRLMVRQELKLGDYAKRLTYSHWFNMFVHDGMHKMDRVFFSDEAWMHLDGYVNAQNYRLWCAKNPHKFVESGHHPQKITIWYAISQTRVVGPFFFEETVNQEVYQNIIHQFIASLTVEERWCYFQQDGERRWNSYRNFSMIASSPGQLKALI